MSAPGKGPVADVPDLDEQAAHAFLQLRQGGLAEDARAALRARLANEPAFAEAFQRAGGLWQSIDQVAASPELMAMRQQAIVRARRSSAGRWRESLRGKREGWRSLALVASALVLALIVQLSPLGYHPGVYSTGIGEQRVIELEDHSRIALDARTRLRVRYSNSTRTVTLVEGQAQFSVAKDPARPFKVQVGERTVIALGTVFNVEYVDRQIRVTMLEGRVAVLPSPDSDDIASLTDSTGPTKRRLDGGAAASRPIELGVGEQMHIVHDGRATVGDADLDAATAWRRGKVIFHDLPLDQAVLRLNRYSRLQLEIDDPTLAALPVSGVFEAGNTGAFAEALESYLPLTADYSEPGSVRLRRR